MNILRDGRLTNRQLSWRDAGLGLRRRGVTAALLGMFFNSQKGSTISLKFNSAKDSVTYIGAASPGIVMARVYEARFFFANSADFCLDASMAAKNVSSL